MKDTEHSIEAAAAYWFAKRRSDSVSRSEQARFLRWLNQDPAHQAAYSEYESLWTSIGAVAGDPAIVAMRTEALAAAPRRAILGWRAMGAVAATLAVFLLVGVLLMSRGEIGGPAPERQIAQSDAPRMLRTAVGERSAVTLDDGSVVELNTDSQLVVDYGDRVRAVRLIRGQAMFEVAHDSARPFVVEAAGQRIVALGTAFDVRVDSDGMRVTLIEGRVSVEPVGDTPHGVRATRTLVPGEQLVARADQPIVVLPADVRQAVSWRTGRLAFSDEPLGEVVEEINRYSNRKVVLADPSLAELRVSCAFRAGSVGSFATAMETAFPVSAESHGDEIVLSWE